MDLLIENILSETNKVILKYDEVSKKSGENFNIFKILNLTSNEVRTHSAFLAEILSSNGSHEKGNSFLKEFLKIIKLDFNFNIEYYTTEIEKHIGFINDNYDEGGRIDIILTDNNNNCIIIENKIYAGDQSKQLKRYYNFNPKAKLVYLTLYGDAPSKDSLDGLNPDIIQNISYSNEILSWLETCRNISINQNALKEAINQYIHLVRFLTNKSTNTEMEKEIFELITENKEKFISSLKIGSSTNALLDIMHKDFLSKMIASNQSLYKTIQHNGFIFNFHQGEDNDGLFVGVSVTEKNVLGVINKHQFLIDIGVKIKKEFPFSFSNNNYLGWITPLGNKTKYDYLDNGLKFELYTDQNKLALTLNDITFKSEAFLSRVESIILNS